MGQFYRFCKLCKVGNKMMDEETLKNVLERLDKKIKLQERFLNKVSFIMSRKDANEILKDACWVDGTIQGQVQYSLNKRIKLIKSYNLIKNKYGKKRKGYKS